MSVQAWPPGLLFAEIRTGEDDRIMTQQTELLCSHRVFYHFRQICRIPHGSGNEKALSDFIFQWARGIGLEAEQDDACNVFIRKPASPGMEEVPGVLLQAHLDMVCEKGVGVEHDFLRDPIDWVIEGDTLSTGGKTTLGADNGIGVALAMAVLEDASLVHPALEVLFTTMEEEDMSGAERFDSAKMRSRYLINLDHVSEHDMVCGSCGGMEADFYLSLVKCSVPKGWAAYRLSVSGLRGGHSGEDIHRGRGNANILLARLLLAAKDVCPYLLTEIRGGSFRLAIPREAEAVLCLDPDQAPALMQALDVLKEEICAELSDSGPQIKIALEQAASSDSALEGVEPDKVVQALTLIPDGICQMNEFLTGLVDTSDNLGEVYLEDGELHLVLEIRSARESLRTYLYQKMEQLAALLGGRCSCSRSYPSWHFQPSSKLRQICMQAYSEYYGGEPAVHTVHAGLEVGYLLERRPDVDAVSIGPDCWDFHSPAETVSISSVKNFYIYLCKLLALIR